MKWPLFSSFLYILSLRRSFVGITTAKRDVEIEKVAQTEHLQLILTKKTEFSHFKSTKKTELGRKLFVPWRVGLPNDRGLILFRFACCVTQRFSSYTHTLIHMHTRTYICTYGPEGMTTHSQARRTDI